VDAVDVIAARQFLRKKRKLRKKSAKGRGKPLEGRSRSHKKRRQKELATHPAPRLASDSVRVSRIRGREGVGKKKGAREYQKKNRKNRHRVLNTKRSPGATVVGRN